MNTKPDFAIISKNGKKTDKALHVPLLDNAAANALADQNAFRTAIAMGYSQDEASEMFLAPFDAGKFQRTTR